MATFVTFGPMGIRPNIAKKSFMAIGPLDQREIMTQFGKQPFFLIFCAPFPFALNTLSDCPVFPSPCARLHQEKNHALTTTTRKPFVENQGLEGRTGMAVWVSCLFSMVISNSCCVALYSFFSTTLPNHQNLITMFDTVLILTMTSVVNILVSRVLQ